MPKFRNLRLPGRAGLGALALAVALALLPACEPEGSGSMSSPEASSETENPTTSASEENGAYDPAKDALVNVPSMFEPRPTASADVNWEETLYRSCDGNPASLNPLFMSSTYEFFFADLQFSGLFTFDADMQWQVNKTMVETFTESDDHLRYTVKLREGLTWHDGHPFTSADVVFSYDNIMDERVPCPAVRTGTDQLAYVKAIDERTVEIGHNEPLPTAKWNALFPVIPKHIYEVDKENNPDLKTGEYYVKYNRAPVGNGPYRLVEWVENQRLVLEAWDEFPGPRPPFKRIVFRIVPDKNILMQRFNKGDVDEFRMSTKQFATQTGPGSDFSKRGFKLQSPQWGFSYLGWNQDGSNPFFSDKRVRHAMAHAMDLERIRSKLIYNLYEPCHGIYHPDSWMSTRDIAIFPYDLKKAGEILDEAGWKIDRSRGGWRHKEIDGKPVKFEFSMLIPQASSIGPAMAAIFQDDLKSIGVSLKTRILEWATYQERTRKHEFQCCTAAWGTGTDPDTGWNLWHSTSYTPDGLQGRNYGGFKSDRVDELLSLARVELNPKKRADYYGEMAEVIYEEQPYLFLFNRATLWGMSDRIRGITTSPRGCFNFSPAEMGWWVPAEKN